jgi:hypothetical protein
MKFVDQQPSRMQRQFFLEVGQFGQQLLAGIKKIEKINQWVPDHKPRP